VTRWKYKMYIQWKPIYVNFNMRLRLWESDFIWTFFLFFTITKLNSALLRFIDSILLFFMKRILSHTFKNVYRFWIRLP
jgi:hypothetical protein